jgi:hypothetical protein
MSDALLTAMKVVVDLLVRGEYAVLAKVDQGGRLTPEDLRHAVERYGRTLIPIPPQTWSQVGIVEVKGSTPRRYMVAVDLWTLEEGRSDLTLELQLVALANGTFTTEILDLHTL